MADGQVVFDITGNNQPIQKSLDETTKKIQDESKKWDKSVDDSSGNISSSLVGAFNAVVTSAAFIKVGQMLLQFGAESIQLASDLEEVQNVVDVTFGTEGSKKIESWAKAASSQFGLTELQAKQYASTLGAMMKSNGMTSDEVLELSTDLAGLAADMASFYNMDFDTAFSKIQSAMAGMTLPMRQLGIDMTEGSLSAFAMAEGMETAYSKMSEKEQQLVRYRYLMKVTADAQGDFARTSDSFANSQRRMATGFDTLKAQIGDLLLPIATDVSNAINDLLDILIYKPPETAFDVAEDSMSDAVKTATQAQGILGYMDQLQQKYGEAASSTGEWAAALERLKEVFPEVNKYIDTETGSLTASNEQLKAYVENSKQAAIEDAKRAALNTLSNQYVEAGQKYYTAEINRDMALAQAEQARMDLIGYIRSKPGNEEFTGEGFSMKQLEDAAYAIANEFGESQSMIKEWSRIYNEQTGNAEKFGNEMVTLKSKMTSLESDLNIASQALERLAAAAGSAASSTSGGGGLWTYSDRVKWYNSYYGSHASGLDFVPFDGYVAKLHRGERIQTAAEASLLRMMGSTQPAVDYSNIGAALWSGAPKMGGDVYLDGRTVGKVLSEIQGRSYRSLQRSGWQA